MTQGLIASKVMEPGSIHAEIWCAPFNEADAFMEDDDVAIVSFRFTTTKRAKTYSKIKARFKFQFPNLHFEALTSTKEVQLDLTCQTMDGKMWNTAIFHCKTPSSNDYVISTLSAALSQQ